MFLLTIWDTPESGSPAAQEDMLILDARPVLKVGEYGVANLLRKRKPYFATAFAFYKNAAILPVDVRKAKCGHIAGTKTQSRQ